MKRILVPCFVLMFTVGLSAQENDSILLEKVKNLKTELSILKKKQKNLQSKVYQLQKVHEADQKKADEALAATDEAIENSNAKTSELKQDMAASEENTLDSLTTLGEWANQHKPVA